MKPKNYVVNLYKMSSCVKYTNNTWMSIHNLILVLNIYHDDHSFLSIFINILSDSLDSCSGADYQGETPIAKVKGNLKLNVAFWEHIGASRSILDTGCRSFSHSE